ncbi:hypothetical protein NP493_87g01036 [Ridgeia piscesae]|uniref:Defensin-like protein n=1 Tax=Ridgeia piscesae TaxID=27915 RepID=A0AAD9P8J5_RIDPI|nr:hypothetical protein NP493_87g01036 [Ridgeia piscesae]
MTAHVLYVVLCIFLLFTSQVDALGMCSAKCRYNSCKKICMRSGECYCSNRIYGVCKCHDSGPTNCFAICKYNSCRRSCWYGAVCYCSSFNYGVCKCCAKR